MANAPRRAGRWVAGFAVLVVSACGSAGDASTPASTSALPLSSTTDSTAPAPSSTVAITVDRTSSVAPVSNSTTTVATPVRSPSAAFVGTDRELLTVEPSKGIVRRTLLPMVSDAQAPLSLLALKGGVIVLDGTDDGGRFVPDGGQVRALEHSVKGSVGIYPAAEPTHFWAEFAHQANGLADIRHMGLDGAPTGTLIESMGERFRVWGWDGEGWPAVTDGRSVWSAHPNALYGVADGTPLATGNGNYLLAACSSGTCAASLVSHVAKTTAAVPVKLPASQAASGAIAPDGSAAIVGFGDASNAEAWLVDLGSGSTTDLGPLAAGPNVIAWSTDSRYGYVVTAAHELLVLDRDATYAAAPVELGGDSIGAVATPPVVP